MYAFYIKTLIKNEKKLKNISTAIFRYNTTIYKNLFVEIWKIESGILLIGNKIVFFNFIHFHRYIQNLKRQFRWLK